MLKIAGQEHPDRHRPTIATKQWMAPAVDKQLNQLFHTQFHHKAPPKFAALALSLSRLLICSTAESNTKALERLSIGWSVSPIESVLALVYPKAIDFATLDCHVRSPPRSPIIEP
jgi:hypothetical protein